MRPDLARRGLTLVEILVAAAVLGALLLPLLTLFSNTTRLVGGEMAHAHAARLADEVMAQVGAVHRRLGRLGEVPSGDHVGGRSSTGELDLETYARTFEREMGLILLPVWPEDARGSRLHLTRTRRGFRRFLTIGRASAGPKKRNRGVDVLWRARVRVEFDLTMSGRDVRREVLVDSLFFQKCGPERKFQAPE